MTSRPKRLLDDAAWRILNALQNDARLSFNELGRRIGLSAPAVAERVRRMEEAGIIAGYHLAVRLEKLFPIHAIMRVSAPEQNCVALGARAREFREVIEAYRVTGDDRLVLKVVAESVEHLDWLIAELSRYGTVTTSIVLRSRWRPVSRLSPSVPGSRADDRRPTAVQTLETTVSRGVASAGANARRRRRAE